MEIFTILSGLGAPQEASMRPWRRAVAIRANPRKEVKKLLATIADRRRAPSAKFRPLTEAETAAILGREWLARVRAACGEQRRA
jgi:hypothetical protein